MQEQKPVWLQTEGRRNVPGLQKPSEFRLKSPKHFRTAGVCSDGEEGGGWGKGKSKDGCKEQEAITLIQAAVMKG